jgi:hypothetical protein
MLTRRAYDYVAAEYQRREDAGQTPTVRVHLTSGEALTIDTVMSFGDERSEWVAFYTVGEDDVTEVVPLECVARITVTRSSDTKQAPGFTVEERPAV